MRLNTPQNMADEDVEELEQYTQCANAHSMCGAKLEANCIKHGR